MMRTSYTLAMHKFLQAEQSRVTSISIEPDGVFIMTRSIDWCDDAGSGTFRGDNQAHAIRVFYERVRKAEPALFDDMPPSPRNPRYRGPFKVKS